MKAVNVDIDIEAARQAIEESTLESSVYVGCDSVVLGDKVAYVTVVILHHDSCNGGRIFKDIKIEPTYGDMKIKNRRLRLMYEVYKVAEIGYKIFDCVGDRHFEIHLDLNPKIEHGSNAAVKEAAGYIMATFGIEPKLKPNAFAASCASDHFAVNIRDGVYHRKAVRKQRRMDSKAAKVG